MGGGSDGGYFASGGGGGGLIVPGQRQTGGGGGDGGGGVDANDRQGETITGSSQDQKGKGGGGGGWGANGGNSVDRTGGTAGVAILSEFELGNPIVARDSGAPDEAPILGLQQSNNIGSSAFMSTDIDLSGLTLSNFVIVRNAVSNVVPSPNITYSDGTSDELDITGTNTESHTFE